MKLKKIASLALAGVMAVSMLAGCSTPNKGNDNTDTTTTTANFTSQMVEALEEKVNDAAKANKVETTVSADATLQANLEKVAAMYGYGLTDKTAEAGLKSVAQLKTDNLPSLNDPCKYETATTTSTVMSAVATTIDDTQTVTAAVNKLVKQIMEVDKTDANEDGLAEIVRWKGPKTFTSTAADKTVTTHEVTYSYDIKVATVEVYNTVTEKTTCVVAYTVARVPHETTKTNNQ